MLRLSVLMAVWFALHTHTAWAQTSAAPETAEDVKLVVSFPEETMGIQQWMAQHQWTTTRHDPSRFEVGDRRLRLVSQDDSIMIGTQHGFPLDPHQWSRIRFRFKIIKMPTGTDNTQKSGDDSALRIYVPFDRGKGLFGPSHTIVYAWTEHVEAGTLIQSPYFKKQLRYLSIGKGMPGESGWITIERDLLQDYRRAFPDDDRGIPDLVGILLKCDSNNTGTSAESWLATVELVAPAR